MLHAYTRLVSHGERQPINMFVAGEIDGGEWKGGGGGVGTQWYVLNVVLTE